jgi:hypothetical protein
MATELEIIEYAERLYTKLIDNFDPNKSPFALKNHTKRILFTFKKD